MAIAKKKQKETLEKFKARQLAFSMAKLESEDDCSEDKEDDASHLSCIPESSFYHSMNPLCVLCQDGHKNGKTLDMLAMSHVSALVPSCNFERDRVYGEIVGWRKRGGAFQIVTLYSIINLLLTFVNILIILSFV